MDIGAEIDVTHSFYMVETSLELSHPRCGLSLKIDFQGGIGTILLLGGWRVLMWQELCTCSMVMRQFGFDPWVTYLLL